MIHDPDAVDLDILTQTRASLHQLAEHALAAARHQADGRIGLRVVPGGIATPPFGDGRTIAVIGHEFIVSDASGTRGQDLSTVANALEAAGIAPGGPADVYQLTTRPDPDAQLTFSDAAARQLFAWFNLANSALGRFVEAHAHDHPSSITLWPEHFDLAISMGACNYGASLGDDGRSEPYLYVGPHSAEQRPTSDPFWNEPYGAAVSWREITDVEAAEAFFESGLAHLT